MAAGCLVLMSSVVAPGVRPVCRRSERAFSTPRARAGCSVSAIRRIRKSLVRSSPVDVFSSSRGVWPRIQVRTKVIAWSLATAVAIVSFLMLTSAAAVGVLVVFLLDVGVEPDRPRGRRGCRWRSGCVQTVCLVGRRRSRDNFFRRRLGERRRDSWRPVLALLIADLLSHLGCRAARLRLRSGTHSAGRIGGRRGGRRRTRDLSGHHGGRLSPCISRGWLRGRSRIQCTA